MCGIVYMHNLAGQPVNIDIMNQYDRQCNRGQQGFGLFDGQFGNMVRHSKEDGILKWLDKYPSNMIMFHHRFPTSTVNVKRAAHPFSTKKYFGDNQYILVHNGMIRNATKLFGNHIEEGIEYQSLLDDDTFNDSEALLWDFALTMEGKQKELKAYGAIAFVCMKLVKGKVERLYFGRNHNPLNLFRDKDNISLSSEGEGEPIEPGMLYNYHYGSKRLVRRTFAVPAYDPDYKYEYTGESARGGASGQGAGFQGSAGAYTPGSYADGSANTGTARTEANGDSYPTIFDCNCDQVGWENCEYHGAFDALDDFRDAQAGIDHLRGKTGAGDSDDTAAYHSWWNDKVVEEELERTGNWLGHGLKRKYGRLVEAAVRFRYSGKDTSDSSRANEGGEVKGFELDGQTQLFLPAGTRKQRPLPEAIPEAVVREVRDNATPLGEALKQHFDRKTAEQIFVMQKKMAPDGDEVLQVMLEYLTTVQGNFEMAYIQVEQDYELAEAAPDTATNIRLRYLLEKVMERMQNDEDFVNENSVSGIWQETRQKQEAL